MNLLETKSVRVELADLLAIYRALIVAGVYASDFDDDHAKQISDAIETLTQAMTRP